MKKRFEMLYREYRDTVYGYLYYMCREEELARDLSQETFSENISGDEEIPPGSAAKRPGVITIARNTFLSYARKKQPMLLGEEILEAEEDAEANRPEEQVIRQEKIKSIRDVLAKLSEDERTILLLRDYEGISYEEIARILKITESNVKVKLHRIRQKYRRLYLRETGSMEE